MNRLLPWIDEVKKKLARGGLGRAALSIALVLSAFIAVALDSTFGVNCSASFVRLAGFQLDGLSADRALRPVAQK